MGAWAPFLYALVAAVVCGAVGALVVPRGFRDRFTGWAERTSLRLTEDNAVARTARVATSYAISKLLSRSRRGAGQPLALGGTPLLSVAGAFTHCQLLPAALWDLGAAGERRRHVFVDDSEQRQRVDVVVEGPSDGTKSASVRRSLEAELEEVVRRHGPADHRTLAA